MSNFILSKVADLIPSNLGLDQSHMAVLSQVARGTNYETGVCILSYRTIALYINRSVRHTMKLMGDLVAAGLVEVKRRHRQGGLQTSNFYKINVPYLDRLINFIKEKKRERKRKIKPEVLYYQKDFMPIEEYKKLHPKCKIKEQQVKKPHNLASEMDFIPITGVINNNIKYNTREVSIAEREEKKDPISIMQSIQKVKNFITGGMMPKFEQDIPHETPRQKALARFSYLHRIFCKIYPSDHDFTEIERSQWVDALENLHHDNWKAICETMVKRKPVYSSKMTLQEFLSHRAFKSPSTAMNKNRTNIQPPSQNNSTNIGHKKRWSDQWHDDLQRGLTNAECKAKFQNGDYD